MNNLQIAQDHGLTEKEYSKIVNTIGREPNLNEIGILGAMWSEHCSYKSSRVHLKKFPTTGDHVIQGPGENAGIIDIGNGLCAVFKMESHNHPSFIEPYQGAATGVGGILRDIFTMGARPIALLNSLRFGNSALPKTKYLLEGVVSGIAGYGNCVGIPTVGGEIYFDDCYNGNPLVNVFALGITKKDKIFRGYAKGIGNPVVYIGSKTGRDGIHGAVMASESFSEESEEKRPTVQVGDPFTEKLLLEACLELFKTDAVVGIQDMGAAGLTSSSTEMAERAGSGLKINIDNVPTRELEMKTYEIMLSESQERMLVVLEKGKEQIAEKIFKKWNIDFSVIGEVTDNNRLEIYEKHNKVVDLPIELITNDSPVYSRPFNKPEYLRDMHKLELSSLPEPSDYSEALITLLSSPTISNKKWIYEQYDHMVRTNTAIEQGSDSAVLRIKNADIGLSITVNCNSRYCYLDPYIGSIIAVCENARNLACSGAKPLAITDCLNFGNPEKPEIMWQFIKSIEGISYAAKKLNTPVVSGNVSFYNQTDQTDIYPTPTIAMVGLIENINNIMSQWFVDEGDFIFLLGQTKEDIEGTEYLKLIHNQISGTPPSIDINAEIKIIDTLLKACKDGIIKSAHDISEGGISVAIAEACFRPSRLIGVDITLPNNNGLRNDILLFSESQSRVIVTIDENDLSQFETLISKNNIYCEYIGKVGGNSININNLINIPLLDAYNSWDSAIEKLIK